MPEKIEVAYKYTGIDSSSGEGSVRGVPMYHKVIIYTDHNGNEFYARGSCSLLVGHGGVTPMTPLGVIEGEYGAYQSGTIDYDLPPVN